MSDAMTEVYRGTYFKDRSKLTKKQKSKPQAPKNKSNNKK